MFLIFQLQARIICIWEQNTIINLMHLSSARFEKCEPFKKQNVFIYTTFICKTTGLAAFFFFFDIIFI